MIYLSTMFFSLRSKPRYSSLEDADYTDELKVRGSTATHVTVGISSCGILSFIALLLLSGASVSSFFLGRHTAPSPGGIDSVRTLCTQPTIRKEWRTLSKTQKSAYISAVQCLSTKPSKLRENGTLYDDFPWVHQSTAPSGKSVKTSLLFPSGVNPKLDWAKSMC